MAGTREIGRQRIALVATIAILTSVPACRGSEPLNETNAAEPQPATNLAAKVPLPEAPMDRAALMQAVFQARSAAAAGQDDSQAQRQLDGKQFEVRIRFGCRGPVNVAAKPVLGWSYDEKAKVLRIRAASTIASDDPALSSANLQGVETVEGFWIPRPWLLQPVCPAKPQPSEPVPGGADSAHATAEAPEPSADADEKSVVVVTPKVGLAQFFTSEDARTRRRDSRPYETTKSLDGAPDSSQGYDLVISGRLRATAAGRVIICTGATPDRAPDCIVSIRTDRIRFDNPSTGEIVAQWSSS